MRVGIELLAFRRLVSGGDLERPVCGHVLEHEDASIRSPFAVDGRQRERVWLGDLSSERGVQPVDEQFVRFVRRGWRIEARWLAHDRRCASEVVAEGPHGPSFAPACEMDE